MRYLESEVGARMKKTPAMVPGACSESLEDFKTRFVPLSPVVVKLNGVDLAR